MLIRVAAIRIEGGDPTDRREGKTRYTQVSGYAAAGTIVALGRGVDGSVHRAGAPDRVLIKAAAGIASPPRAAPAPYDRRAFLPIPASAAPNGSDPPADRTWTASIISPPTRRSGLPAQPPVRRPSRSLHATSG